MNHKNAGIKSSNSVAKNWILAIAIAGLLPGMAMAEVAGVWDTTALTRIDVTPIKAPGLIPEHSVEISEGNYNFNAGNSFNAADINGTWKQRKNQYTVTVNRSELESQFRTSLQTNDPNILINQLKLVKSSFSGYELDNGIWGSERFEYKIDTTLDGYRDVIRLVMTVQVAGYPHSEAAAGVGAKSFAAISDTIQPQHNTAIDTAVAAVLKHLKQRSSRE